MLNEIDTAPVYSSIACIDDYSIFYEEIMTLNLWFLAGVIVVHVRLLGRLGGARFDQRYFCGSLRQRGEHEFDHCVGARTAVGHSVGRRETESDPRLESAV